MPIILAAGGPEIALLFVELGAIFVSLALAARLGNLLGFSPIPFFLIIGIAFGAQTAMPVEIAEEFIAAGAEIGVILLLFMLGLEYTGSELREAMQQNFKSGLLDIALNFTPGFLFGLLLGWDFVLALLLGGVTYISSSGIISKLLSDTQSLGNRETPAILSVLVFEDLVMALYLPLMTILLLGGTIATAAQGLAVAIVTVIAIAFMALRFSGRITQVVSSQSTEIVVLSVLGIVFLVGGLAQSFQVSAAVAAFLVGIALSSEMSEHVHEIFGSLKDMFAALFFVYFGLNIDPATLPPVLIPALILATITGITKIATGVYGARQLGVSVRGQARAGVTLSIRGEFSIVIAGLAAAAGIIAPELTSLAAAYVLAMALAGPVLLRFLDPIMDRLLEPATQARLAPVQSATVKASGMVIQVGSVTTQQFYRLGEETAKSGWQFVQSTSNLGLRMANSGIKRTNAFIKQRRTDA